MIFAGVMALAAALQIVVMIMAALAAGKVIKDARDLSERVEAKVMPIMNKTNSLIDELTPKVRTISENVSEITYTVRSKVDELSATVDELNRTMKDANLKTKAQIHHVDRMVGTALTSTEEFADTVIQGIRAPMRQVAGVLAGVRTGVERLAENFGFNRRPSSRNEPGRPDIGM